MNFILINIENFVKAKNFNARNKKKQQISLFCYRTQSFSMRLHYASLSASFPLTRLQASSRTSHRLTQRCLCGKDALRLRR